MNWDVWERVWRLNATTPRFAKKVAKAKQIAREGHARGRLFCSLSGGKDSVALAGLLCEAGIDVRSVYAHSELVIPDTWETVVAVADRLDLDLHIIQPDPSSIEEGCAVVSNILGIERKPKLGDEWSEWDILNAIPRNHIVFGFYDVIGGISAGGNMLVSYTHEHGFDGSFDGRRAEESRARTMQKINVGPIHKHKTDGKWSVCPLMEWTGQDVWSFILSRDLPIHPYYRRAWDGGLRTDDPSRLRVDSAITPEHVASKGALALIAQTYPEFWAKLVSFRPELNQYR
jgi:3'-phosphoadenosine 5'-phosphosulfate sulfotransferase (PAPS reductase)/FAD synthetase